MKDNNIIVHSSRIATVIIGDGKIASTLDRTMLLATSRGSQRKTLSLPIRKVLSLYLLTWVRDNNNKKILFSLLPSHVHTWMRPTWWRREMSTFYTHQKNPLSMFKLLTNLSFVRALPCLCYQKT